MPSPERDREQAENPYAAPGPKSQARRKVIVLPGWVLLFLGICVLGMGVFGFMPGFMPGERVRFDDYVFMIMYGLPMLICVLVFAPTSIRLGRSPGKAWSALACALGGVVAAVARLMG